MKLAETMHSCRELGEKATPYAVVTLIKIDGHVPQEVGSKMIVTAQGHFAGTIGGGKFEAKGIELAQSQLKARTPTASLHRIDLSQDLGMACGGVGTIFIESINCKRWTIAVYGAGHVGQALAKVLSTLECDLIFADSRADWLGRIEEQFRDRVRTILADNLATVPASLPHDTFHVIATPGHLFDLVVLREVLNLGTAPYIGVIGSKVKARKVRATLLNEGFSENQVNSFYCPMGLDIGNNSPPEIAISIAAQLLEHRHNLVPVD